MLQKLRAIRNEQELEVRGKVHQIIHGFSVNLSRLFKQKEIYCDVR